MGIMAKKKPTDESGAEPKKRPPSRDAYTTVNVRKDLLAAVERYAESKTTAYDEVSASRVVRQALVEFLTKAGFWPPQGQEGRQEG